MSNEVEITVQTAETNAYSPEWIRDEVIRIIEIFESGQMPPIVQLGHPVLRAQAADFTDQLNSELLRRLLDTMRAVMLNAPGVGLAAPQLGIPLRIAVLQDLYETTEEIAAVREREPLEYFEIINPIYSAIGTRTATFYEGCLSFNGYQGVVERPADIATSYLDADGAAHEKNFSGWQARIFQHETDHLSGTVYIDKAITRSLCANHEYVRWTNPDIAEAKIGLNF
ncbi:peptide deformylase [Arthrobacter sp. MYb227]|uniref:peptide deformylase n=1 Tax=Arthrobacter sp. MYb227 TaxID=1848601 RepID=UPI000CFC7106|nr:peptide deformylase [Arthrobacter sp. MYb227]PQZ93895.1 peptide deformylase [Arthrobacter sp. MYb227]